MPAYLTSGSAIERAIICTSSLALPHANYETPYSRRGTVIHEFLQGVTLVGRDKALEQIDEPDMREVCAELEIDRLHDRFNLAAEVALAYDPTSDTARELGRGEGRKYSDVGEDEIPCTLDVVGIREHDGERRGIYVEWKSGWTTRRPIGKVGQIFFGSLALARAFDCTSVEGQLVNVYEGFQPSVQRIEIDAVELDAFASLVRDMHRLGVALREQYALGKIPTEFHTGPWCEGCQAREFCPAQTALLRAVLGRDLFDGEMRMGTLDDKALASVWGQIHAAESILSTLKRRVLGVAAVRTIALGKSPDGKDRWLGRVIVDGNDKIDGEIAYDAIEELYGADVASAATVVTATKKAIKAALKASEHGKRGKLAASEREVYDRIKAAGGIRTVTKYEPREYTTKPGEPPPDSAQGVLASEAERSER